MLAMTFIKSLIFFVAYFINFFIFITILFASTLTFNRKLIINIIKHWNENIIFLLKLICNIDYKVKISEKFNNDAVYLMLMKHESAWETYFLYQYFDKPAAPIAKKELAYIPLFGQLLVLAGTIFVDRDGGLSSIKNLVKKSKYNLLEKGRSVIMAPQGTRVPVGGTAKEYPYKSGFVAVAQNCNIPILPIVLDSGKCWPKGSFLKHSGVINVSIMDPIPVDVFKKMNREELTKFIENIMEDERSKMK